MDKGTPRHGDMDDEALREAHERALRAKDVPGATSGLALDRLERLVSGEGSESERLRALDIAMSSAEGRREFEIALAAARAARAEGSARTRGLAGPRASRIAAAAAVLLVASTGSYLFVKRDRAEGAPRTEREAMRGASSGVTLITPRVTLANIHGSRFAWRAVPTAERYTMVLVDQQGNELFASTTRDTSVAVPDSVAFRAGATYLWWVEAVLRDGSTATATIEKFIVQPGG